MIASWWAALSPVMRIIWVVTLSASLVFIIQSILTFIGADADSSFEMDADGVDAPDMDGGSNLYTFRNFVNFLLGFGWSFVLLQENIPSTFLLVVVSVAVGVALVAAVMYLFKWLSSMQQSGNIDVNKVAKGCEGTVYLTIPAARSGEGKVQISIAGAIREYNAVTEGDAPLKTGTPIRVVDVVNADTVIVEETNSYTI